MTLSVCFAYIFTQRVTELKPLILTLLSLRIFILRTYPGVFACLCMCCVLVLQ